MRESVRLLLLLLVVVFAFAATAQAANSADGKDNDKSDDLQHRLNQGYSMLYDEVSGIANADKVFLVKFETDATQRVVTALADYLDQLTPRLERMAAGDPALRIDLDPLPLMEQRKKDAATTARLKNLAPVVGRTGPGFERTLLLTLSGGANRMRHLVRVMAEIENHPQRRRLLQQVDDRLTALRDDMLQRLRQHFYVQEPGGESNP